MSSTCQKESTRSKLLNKIRELEFAAVDLNLYLDNHPDNEKALNDYNAITKDLIAMKKRYEAEYGPLANFGSSQSMAPWAWVNEPWPWEMD